MDDLVHGDRAHPLARVRRLERGQVLLHLREPLVEQLRRARVQRGEGADDAGLALRQHQFRIADDEHRRGDDGQGQVLQDGRQGLGGGHEISSDRVAN
ncbi:hypothetical protein D3C81_1558300 [compost metagenome]